MKDKVKTTRNTLSKIVTAISQVSSSDEFLFLSLVRITSSRTACNNRLFLFIICSIQLLQVHERTLLSILFLSQPPFCDEEPPEMERSTHTYTFKNIHWSNLYFHNIALHLLLYYKPNTWKSSITKHEVTWNICGVSYEIQTDNKTNGFKNIVVYSEVKHQTFSNHHKSQIIIYYMFIYLLNILKVHH